MKIILFIVAFYIGYRVLKSWFVKKLQTAAQNMQTQGAGGQVDDVMVKDPFCNVYFPQREGIELLFEGKTYYFCSKSCKEKFLEMKTGKVSD